MNKIGMIIAIIGLIISIVCFFVFLPDANALTPYDQCLIACSSLPVVSEYKDCDQEIYSQRLNCKMDCYVEHNMPKDPDRERALEFWDRAVRNFPNEN